MQNIFIKNFDYLFTPEQIEKYYSVLFKEFAGYEININKNTLENTYIVLVNPNDRIIDKKRIETVISEINI